MTSARIGDELSSTPLDPNVLCGVGVSPGIVTAPLVRLASLSPPVERREITEDEIPGEIEAFRAAIRDVVSEIIAVRERAGEEFGSEAREIFDAHLHLLEDPLAIDATERTVTERRINAAYCFRENMLRILAQFDSMRDGAFKERSADIRDVKRQVLRRLVGAPAPDEHVAGAIVAVDELTPSETMVLCEKGAVGIVTERGGSTGHAAIMLRARGLPAVMGVHQLRERTRDGSRAVLDGERGELILDPMPEVEARFERRIAAAAVIRDRLARERTFPSVTGDGREIHLHANVELPDEVAGLVDQGASGIGLFRTEFFLLQGSRLPDEEEQLEVYRKAVQTMAPRPIVFRTMDFGGDKLASFLGTDRERNPFLGQRGIRFLLEHPETFRTQLRALLRASAYGPVRLLFPMITTPEELRAARHHVETAMHELQAEGKPFDRHVRLGVMIETPAAVFMADHLAKECDFFSIGSNDLTQYTLAVDRTNAKLSYLFNSLHPSVLRAIRGTVHAAHREGCSVSVCGEMAGEMESALLLVGLGVDDLSMAPVHIPEVNHLVRGVTFEEARDLAIRAIRFSTVGEVETLVREFLNDRFPDWADLKGW